MSALERHLAPTAIVACFALAFVGSVVTGCASESARENAATAARYGVELDACVVQAQTLAESRRCRCEVSTRHRRPCDTP